MGKGTFEFGNGVSVTGVITALNYLNSILLLKYNNSVVAQRARIMTSGSNGSYYSCVFVEEDGSIYAVRSINSTGVFNFGNITTVAGKKNSNYLLVKYDAFGMAQWAKPVTQEEYKSAFSSVFAASIGSIYVIIQQIQGKIAFLQRYPEGHQRH